MAVGFAQGWREQGDFLAGQRLQVARAFDEFRRNNPYASLEEFQSFADQVSGGDSYLRGRFPSDQVLSVLGEQNQARRIRDETRAQVQTMREEADLDSVMEQRLGRAILNGADPSRALEDVVSGMSQDPEIRERLRGRITSTVGDIGHFATRVQSQEIERALPGVLNAMRMGLDITPHLASLPEGLRAQVRQRAAQIAANENASRGAAASAAARQQAAAYYQALTGDPVLQAHAANPEAVGEDAVRRRVEMLRLAFPGAPQIALDQAVGLARDGYAARVVTGYEQQQSALRQAGAQVVDRELQTYTGQVAPLITNHFPAGDIRRDVGQRLVQSYFLDNAQQSAMLQWLNGQSRSGDMAAILAEAARQPWMNSAQPLPAWRESRINSFVQQTIGDRPEPFEVWSSNRRSDIRADLQAATSDIQSAIESGNTARARQLLAQAERALAQHQQDIQRRERNRNFTTPAPTQGFADVLSEVNLARERLTALRQTVGAAAPAPAPPPPRPTAAAPAREAAGPRVTVDPSQVGPTVVQQDPAAIAAAQARAAEEERRRAAQAARFDERRLPMAVREAQAQIAASRGRNPDAVIANVAQEYGVPVDELRRALNPRPAPTE